MITESALAKYAERVSEELQRTYGLTWADACGDIEPLAQAIADNVSAAEFAREFAEKYDLHPIPKFCPEAGARVL